MIRIVALSFFIICASLLWRGRTVSTIEKKWPRTTYNYSKNPITEAGINLGRALFYDPILSRDSTISCASCHLQATGFTHVDHDLSHGIEGRIGKRNSMTLMNLAWSKSFMWDGGVPTLDRQAIAPITDHHEMDENLENVLRKINAQPRYNAAFRAAFGREEATLQFLLFAISQFELQLISNNSKYDKVMRHEKGFRFTEQENKGLTLFRKNCEACHTEPLMTNREFENNGLQLDSVLLDFGRMKITNLPEDSLKFKVPTLRNIKFTSPYMHDGRFHSLREVLNHYTDGIHASTTLSKKLQRKIVLTENDKSDLIAFLNTLTDTSFLFNPAFSFPRKFFFP